MSVSITAVDDRNDEEKKERTCSATIVLRSLNIVLVGAFLLPDLSRRPPQLGFRGLVVWRVLVNVARRITRNDVVRSVDSKY